jgi:hypothetical protein
MTRYLCVHHSHEHEGQLRPVDLTSQVRLERSFPPRATAYLAHTEDVIRRMRRVETLDPVDRVVEARRVLTGRSEPVDAPVVLVSETRLSRAPGLYDLDELRYAEPAVEDAVTRFGEASPPRASSDDLVVLLDETDPGVQEQGVQTRTEQRTRVIPQGVFPVRELSVRLADADASEESLVDAIHDVPSFGTTLAAEVRRPWRVVVDCPVAEGDPPVDHRMLFTGTGDPEPPVVLGVPAGGWDAMIEDGAVELDPPSEVHRAERRLRVLLLTQIGVTALAFVLAWIGGGLAFAARETPGWLGFAIALAAGAVVFAVFGLAVPRDPEGNPNDTFVLRGFYERRLEFLWWSTLISASLFAAALVAAFVPPMVAAQGARPALPAPAISFDRSQDPVTARVQMELGGLGARDLLIVDMRTFDGDTDTGTLVGRVTASGDTAGGATVDTSVALDRPARYLAVAAAFQGDPFPTCTPTAAEGPGCTIVAVPPQGAPGQPGTTTIVVPTTPAPALPPDPVPSPSPVPSPTPSPFPVPSPSPSPFAVPS